jgi:hypothetical protein
MPVSKKQLKEGKKNAHYRRIDIAYALGIINTSGDGEVTPEEVEAIKVTREGIDEIADEYAMSRARMQSGLSGIDTMIARLNQEADDMKRDMERLDTNFSDMCKAAGVDLHEEIVGDMFKVQMVTNPPSVIYDDTVSSSLAILDVSVEARIRVPLSDILKDCVNQKKTPVSGFIVNVGEVDTDSVVHNQMVPHHAAQLFADVVAVELPHIFRSTMTIKQGDAITEYVKSDQGQAVIRSCADVQVQAQVVTLPKKEVVQTYAGNPAQVPAGAVILRKSRIAISPNR